MCEIWWMIKSPAVIRNHCSSSGSYFIPKWSLVWKAISGDCLLNCTVPKHIWHLGFEIRTVAYSSSQKAFIASQVHYKFVDCNIRCDQKKKSFVCDCAELKGSCCHLGGGAEIDTRNSPYIYIGPGSANLPCSAKHLMSHMCLSPIYFKHMLKCLLSWDLQRQ